MDVMAIATSAVTLLTPYLVKGIEGFAGEGGKAEFHGIGKLLAKLKEATADNLTGRDTLSRFEQSPERYQAYLQDVLVEALQKNPTLQTEITALLSEIKTAGPTLNIVQKIKVAEDVVGLEADQIGGGRINVDQTVDQTKTVTGVKVNRLP